MTKRLCSLYLTIIGFSLGICVFKTVNVYLWKSDTPVSIVWVCWNELWKFDNKDGFRRIFVTYGIFSPIPKIMWWWWWWWWWLAFVVWLTDERHLAIFPAGTIVRDPYHRESPTRREQGFNLRRTWVQG